MSGLWFSRPLLLAALLLQAGTIYAAELPRAVLGEAVYKKHCAACHDNPEQSKSRSRDALSSMPSPMIAYALRDGRMQSQGALLSSEEVTAVAEYLSGEPGADTSWQAGMRCESGNAALGSSVEVTGFGLGPRNQRYLDESTAGLKKSDMSRLELAWSLAFPGVTEMRAQPAVIGDTLFVSPTQTLELYAFDIGGEPCLRWVYESDVPLRSSVASGEIAGKRVLAVGDSTGRVHALDAVTGARLWRTDLKRFPQSVITGTPVVTGGRVYAGVSQFEIMVAAADHYECCKASGAVVAMDASTGEILWYTPMLPPATPQRDRGDGQMIFGPSGAPVWTSPAIDEKRGVLYVGTGESTSEPAHQNTDAIVAVDLKTGAIRWSFQATAQDIFLSGCRKQPRPLNCPPGYSVERDVDFGASVIIADDGKGGDLLLAGQKSSSVWALDPDNEGKLVWHWNRGQGTPLGGVHWGMAYDGKRLFVPLNDPGMKRAGYQPHPGLYALEASSGELLWEHAATADCEGRQVRAPRCMWYFGFSAAPLVIGEAVVQGSLDGKLLVFDAADGNVLFSYDTLRDFAAVNGVTGNGGAIDNAAMSAANGTLFVNSGYGMFGQPAGNVILAFRPKQQ